jgi:hypothetical protein
MSGEFSEEEIKAIKKDLSSIEQRMEDFLDDILGWGYIDHPEAYDIMLKRIRNDADDIFKRRKSFYDLMND